MAAVQDNQNTTLQLTAAEKLNGFIQKNRRVFFIGLVSAIAILLGIIIIQAAGDKMRSKALSRIEEFESRYQAVKYIPESEGPSGPAREAAREAALLLEELEAFGRKNSGFAAARAYFISAGLYGDQKKWAEAEKAWTEAARLAPKTYLAPISVFNAAVAAEERGSVDTAIALYARAIDYGSSFFAPARAQFSIGRLEESRNNKAAALEAYRTLVNKWPGDPHWADLAQSKIIVLSN
jgi:tetratricopeptide (TPR) repeat protein